MNQKIINIIFRGHAFRPVIKKKTRKPKKHGKRWRFSVGEVFQESIDNQLLILKSIVKNIINPIQEKGYKINISGSVYSTTHNYIIVDFFQSLGFVVDISFVKPHPLQIQSAIVSCMVAKDKLSYYNVMLRLDQFFIKKIPIHFLDDNKNIYYLYLPDKKYNAIADQVHCIPSIYLMNFIDYMKDIKKNPINSEDLSSLHFIHYRHKNIGYLFDKIELGNSNKRTGQDTDPFFFDLPKCKNDIRYNKFL